MIYSIFRPWYDRSQGIGKIDPSYLSVRWPRAPPVQWPCRWSFCCFFFFSGLVRGIATYWSVRWTAALKGFKSFYLLKVLPRWGMRRKQSKYGIIRRPSEILFLRRNANCMVLGQEFIAWSHTLGYCYLSPALSRGIRIFLKGLLGMYFLFRFSDWYSSAVALRVVIEHWAASGLGRRFSG